MEIIFFFFTPEDERAEDVGVEERELAKKKGLLRIRISKTHP